MYDCDEDSEELSREFTRDFTLPGNVDQYSIKAQLEETTRQLTLIGQLTEDAINSLNATTMSELKGASLMQTSAALAAAVISTSSSISSSAATSSSLKTSTATSALSSTIERKSPFNTNTKLGSVVETRQSTGVEYEIYLGNVRLS